MKNLPKFFTDFIQLLVTSQINGIKAWIDKLSKKKTDKFTEFNISSSGFSVKRYDWFSIPDQVF